MININYSDALDSELLLEEWEKILQSNIPTDHIFSTPNEVEELFEYCLSELWLAVYEDAIPCASPSKLNLEQFVTKLMKQDDFVKPEFDNLEEESYLVLRNHRWRITTGMMWSGDEQRVLPGILALHYGKGSDCAMYLKDRAEDVLLLMDKFLPQLKEELWEFIRQN